MSLSVVFSLAVLFQCICANDDYIIRNRRTCRNDIDCGVAFNDVSGNLEDFVHFKVEYLLEGGGFDGAVWVPDRKYPKGGYLLFVLLGPAERSGLYKFVDDGYDIYVNQLILVNSSADVAWSKATPHYAYISSLGGQQIVVVNLKSNTIEKTYAYFEGKQFAGPDGIYADDYGMVYFTDTDYNVVDVDPDTTRPGGSLFRINALTDEIFLEGTVRYGYNGITLNNVYGNGKRLVVSNTVDLPDDIYRIDDNTIEDSSKIYIGEYMRKYGGSLKDRGRYYSITEDIEFFPKKPFLDGMTFDIYDNLYVSVIINQTMSKLIVLNFDDCSDTSYGNTYYIGEIIFAPGFAVNAVTLAGDGYFYASLVNFPAFTEGQFVRFKQRGFTSSKKSSSKTSRSSGSSDTYTRYKSSSKTYRKSSSSKSSRSSSSKKRRYESSSTNEYEDLESWDDIDGYSYDD